MGGRKFFIPDRSCTETTDRQYETGFKLTNSNSCNSSAAYTIDPGTAFPRQTRIKPTRSVTAKRSPPPYLQVSRTFWGFTLQTGATAGKPPTSTAGNWYQDTNLSIHRTDLFPYVYLQQAVQTFGVQLVGNAIYRPQASGDRITNTESLSQIRGSICIRR